MKMTILCGISGSGKSTYVKNNLPKAMECSADHFFMDKGEYKFDPTKLGEAHGACLKKCVELCMNHDEQIVIDNTNTTVSEVAPYAALALAYGYDLEIVILDVPVSLAFPRNAHGVPLGVIEQQSSRLMQLPKQLPPWWPVKIHTYGA